MIMQLRFKEKNKKTVLTLTFYIDKVNERILIVRKFFVIKLII